MKQLTCEMCGSTDLVRDNGVFVCQTCGCKYSVEEAKRMMVEGTVDVKGTVKIDNTPQIQNYLDLSRNAYNAGNGQSAFDYANKALEIAPQHTDAWIAKMKSIEYIATFGNLRMMEVVEAGKNAVTYASEDKKDAVILEVYSYQLTRALELLKLAMSKLDETDSIKSTYRSFCLISLLTATSNTLKADSSLVNLYEGVANEAKALVELIPDEYMAIDPSLPKLAIECARQYQYETDALARRYSVYGAELTASAKSVRQAEKKKLEDKAERAKKKADEIAKKKAEEKRQEEERIRKEQEEKRLAYWAAHQAEKQELEQRIDDLTNQTRTHETAIRTIQEQINQINREADSGQAPSEQKAEEIKRNIHELENQRAGLGLFKGKEKKQIAEQIASLKNMIPSWETIRDEKAAMRQARKPELDALEADRRAHDEAVRSLQEQVKAARDELNKER